MVDQIFQLRFVELMTEIFTEVAYRPCIAEQQFAVAAVSARVVTCQRFGQERVTAAQAGGVIVTVAFNGTAWTEGTEYTYDATTGQFVSTAGIITVPAASYTQDAATGAISIVPGSATLTITGTV